MGIPMQFQSTVATIAALLAAPCAGLPNIVFILVDGLGWNDVPWHNPEVLMPNLDLMAKSGLILEQQYSQPTCSPSRTALLTGYYPYRTGYQFIPPNNNEPVGVPTNFKLLPEHLAKFGYTSHALGKWHLGYCSTEYLPNNRGFESFYGLWNSGGLHRLHEAAGDAHNVAGTVGYDFHLNEKLALGALGTFTEDLFVDRVYDILAEKAGMSEEIDSRHTDDKIAVKNYNETNPLFLYLAYQNVHVPLEVKSKYEALYPNEQDSLRKTYLGMASAVDDSVGRIVNHMKRFVYTRDGVERNLFEDTVFIFSSDNGGMSKGLGYGGASNFPLRGRKGDTWEGGCRVPSFITNINQTGVHSEMFHFTDWLPTIYTGLVGGDLAGLGDIDGVNQMGVLQKTEEPLRSEIVYDIANFQHTNYTYWSTPDWPGDFIVSGSFGAAIRVEDYKLIVGCNTVIGCARNYNSTWEGNTDNNRTLLFDLSTDPEEAVDLAEALPEVVADLRARLDAHLERAVKPIHVPDDPAGLPNNHFPPGQFFTGWCQPIAEPKPDT